MTDILSNKIKTITSKKQQTHIQKHQTRSTITNEGGDIMHLRKYFLQFDNFRKWYFSKATSSLQTTKTNNKICCKWYICIAVNVESQQCLPLYVECEEVEPCCERLSKCRKTFYLKLLLRNKRINCSRKV